MALLRHPAFGVGLVLLVLGLGNWSMGRGKVAEYTSALSSADTGGTPGNFEEFRELDARTNSELLRPLNRGIDAHASTDAKLDFYKVVQTGGQLLAFTGLAMITIATAGAWRRTRALAIAGRPD